MKQVIVFDLDDTLSPELDYLKSAYKAIASTVMPKDSDSFFLKMLQMWRDGLDVFGMIAECFSSWSKDELLSLYRTHFPNITLDTHLEQLLKKFHSQGAVLGLITDGRELTQFNKIKALGLDSFIAAEDIYISEMTGHSKPSPYSYCEFMRRYPECLYYYIGDNIAKDFIAPNQLAWTTIGLRNNGENIHQQGKAETKDHEPQFWVDNLTEIEKIITK